MTVADAVLDVVAELEQQAEALSAACVRDGRDEMLASIARRLRVAVETHRPDWLSVSVACERTGYCPDTIRAKAQELRADGLARKDGGRWLIERGAVERMTTRSKPVAPNEWRDDLAGVARRLAREA